MAYIKEELLDDNKKYYIGLNETSEDNSETLSFGELISLCQKVSAYNQKKAKIFIKKDVPNVTKYKYFEEKEEEQFYQMVFNQKDMKHDIEIRVE